MRNKTKPKGEIDKILNQEGKLMWTRNEYIQAWKHHYEKTTGFRIPQEEDEVNASTNNNIVILDKQELEIAISQMNNNRLSSSDKITIEII